MLDRILSPDRPELHSPEAQNGLMMGFIPARITKVESAAVDPEGLGRIKVQCDLISVNANLPNSYDGWIFVGVEFCNTGTIGGSHPNIQTGNQVALLPMMGNPNQLLMICAIPNRTEKPNPLFDRSKGIYGEQTGSNVFDIKDDQNASRQQIYPHGVTQTVGADGSILNSTKEGGKFSMGADGSMLTANKQASSVISPDGTIVQRSAAGEVAMTLDKKGGATIKSDRYQSEIEMSGSKTTVTGPAPPIFGLLKDLKSGPLQKISQAGAQLGELGGIAQKIAQGDLSQIPGLLSKGKDLIEGISGSLKETLAAGKSTLSKMQDFAPDTLGDYLMPQVNAVLSPQVQALIPKLNEAINQGQASIAKLLSANGLPELATQDLSIVDALKQNQPKQAAQFVLSKVVPGGYSAFANLANLGLHDKIGLINELINKGNAMAAAFSPAAAIATNGLPNQLPDLKELEQIAGKLMGGLPKDLKGIIGKSGIIGEALQGWASGGKINFEGFMKGVLGNAAKGFMSQAVGGLVAASPYAAALPVLQGLISGFMSGKTPDLAGIAAQFAKSIPGLSQFAALNKMIDKPMDFLAGALKPFTGGLKNIFTKGTESLNKVVGSIPKIQIRAKFEASPGLVSMTAANGATGVYASEAGAAITSPWGGFNFSSKGGEVVGDMLMKVAKSLSGPEGAESALSVNKENGVALVGTNQGSKTTRCQVKAEGDTVVIESGQNRILVKPDSITINGYDMLQFARINELIDRLTLTEARLQAIGA